MSHDNDLEERRVKSFLAPLAEIPPATRARRAPIKLWRLITVAVGLTGVAAAGAVAATQTGSLHEVTAQPDPSPLTCSGVIGEPPQQAQSYFEEHGYKISWRYDTFDAQAIEEPSASQPGAVGGYSREVETPPTDSIVSDVLPTDQAKLVVVFTQGA